MTSASSDSRIHWMFRQIVLEGRNRLVNPPCRMKTDGIDIAVVGLVRRQLDGPF
jgi:hypothetical protein